MARRFGSVTDESDLTGPVATSAGVAVSPDRAAPKVGWPLIAVVTVIVFILPLRALLRAAGPAMEEGFMLVFPDRVLHGAVPNKDFLNLYGPGSLWVLAGVYKVFGVHLLAERLVGLAQLVGMAIGGALLVRWWGRWVATAAVVLSAMFLVPALQLTAVPWPGAAALALGSLVALLQARHDAEVPGLDRVANRWALVGGVLAGVALLYRVDIGLAILLGGTAALWRVPRAVMNRALVGLVLGLAPYGIHVAQAGPGTVWRGMLVDPLWHLRAARRLPVPPDPNHLQGVARVIVAVDRWWPLPRLTPPQQLFAWFVLLAAVAIALVGVSVWAVRRTPTAFRPRVLLAGALFGVGVFPQALQRADSAHFAWVSGVLVVLIPAAIVELVAHARPRWSGARAGLIAGVSVIAVGALLLPTYTARRYVALVQDSFGRGDTIALEHDGRTFYVGSDRRFAASITRLLQAVDRDVAPGSRIIVGNSDMRRVPYVDSFLYYLLPRYLPGTYSIEFEPGLTNRQGTRLTEEMRRADAFIASDRWLSWDEPNASMKPGDPGPARVLHQEFCLKSDFGNGYKLYLRCAAPR
jgi:hypothetical protein